MWNSDPRCELGNFSHEESLIFLFPSVPFPVPSGAGTIPRMSDQLNPAQRKAVETLSGPLLVLAGAGSGKTRVVSFRIARLIRHKIQANRILAVTFTNKAASEMQQRVGSLLGKKLKKPPVISTFHAHCVRILRRHIRILGYPEKFAIYDRGDQEGLARSVLREIRVPGEVLRPGDLLYHVSQWKSRSISPSQAAAIAETDKEHLAAMAYRRYQKSLKNAGAVDFDDLLLCTEELLTKHADVRRDEASRFDHILVDEYQDTNGSQYRIVKALAGEHRNLCVVGDDDQSIYGWRGADVQHILSFSRDWPDATVVRLEYNYRSTAAILEVANRLIAFNKVRHDKVLRPARAGGEKPNIQQYRDETAEAKEVVSDIARRLRGEGVEPRDFAILFRTNEQPRAFETELRKAKLPYILLGSMSFFDRKEVRDLLAYLKLLDAPDDEVALLRIINTPPRGIGSKTVEQLMAKAVSQGKPLWRILKSKEATGQMPAVARFVELIEGLRNDLKQGAMLDVAQRLIQKIDYEGELHRLYPNENDFQSRWSAVEEVVNALGSHIKNTKKPSLRAFLDEILLADRDFDNEKENQLRKNAIALLTIHSAKGLEFPQVYMVGMEEGLLPHHRSVKVEGEAIDEERRLCYVGVTRAEERLTLSMALTRMKWGRPRESIPSRFLYEIIGQAENPHAAGKQPSSPHQRPATSKKTRAKRS